MGLLAAMYMDGIQLKLLNREKDINFGSVYENAAAQELKAHGYAIPMAFVFQNENIRVDGRIVYLLIYMLMFLQEEQISESMIYKLDLSGLQ